jgi:hypothetical protein
MRLGKLDGSPVDCRLFTDSRGIQGLAGQHLIQAGPPGSMAGRARGSMGVLRAPAGLLPATRVGGTVSQEVLLYGQRC